jgi:hypothetical protein
MIKRQGRKTSFYAVFCRPSVDRRRRLYDELAIAFFIFKPYNNYKVFGSSSRLRSAHFEGTSYGCFLSPVGVRVL